LKLKVVCQNCGKTGEIETDAIQSDWHGYCADKFKEDTGDWNVWLCAECDGILCGDEQFNEDMREEFMKKLFGEDYE